MVGELCCNRVDMTRHESIVTDQTYSSVTDMLYATCYMLPSQGVPVCRVIVTVIPKECTAVIPLRYYCVIDTLSY